MIGGGNNPADGLVSVKFENGRDTVSPLIPAAFLKVRCVYRKSTTFSHEKVEFPNACVTAGDEASKEK